MQIYSKIIFEVVSYSNKKLLEFLDRVMLKTEPSVRIIGVVPCVNLPYHENEHSIVVVTVDKDDFDFQPSLNYIDVVSLYNITFDDILKYYCGNDYVAENTEITFDNGVLTITVITQEEQTIA